MKELWELLLRSVSTPLRRSLLIVGGFLTLISVGTKTFFQLDYRDVLKGSYLLTGVVIAAVYLAIQFYRYSPRPWAFLSTTVLCFAGIIAGTLAWRAWQYKYDPRGFYCQRRWERESMSGINTKLSLKVIAALNTPSELTLNVVTLPQFCPGIRIIELHPVIPPDLDIRGVETGEQLESSRQFTFQNFRRPIEISFYVTVSNSGSEQILTCFQHSISIEGKLPEDPDKEGGKK